ncbi:hypothetical protein U9M48_008784 [Paspalum notatum var. saurae]|uniref:Uncharacterized protein n=1 Tax=Paspalum notatum var. saurae TaxID=547442 RepID=A0AAQ3WDY4_PASNO
MVPSPPPTSAQPPLNDDDDDFIPLASMRTRLPHPMQLASRRSSSVHNKQRDPGAPLRGCRKKDTSASRGTRRSVRFQETEDPEGSRRQRAPQRRQQHSSSESEEEEQQDEVTKKLNIHCCPHKILFMIGIMSDEQHATISRYGFGAFNDMKIDGLECRQLLVWIMDRTDPRSMTIYAGPGKELRITKHISKNACNNKGTAQTR